MNEVRHKLTVQERAILSDLWQNKDTLRAIKSALSHKQLELAQFGTMLSTDFNQVMRTKGKIEMCNWFVQFLKFNFEAGEKARKKAEEAQVVQE